MFVFLLCFYSSDDYFLATDVTYDQIPLSSANEDLQPVLAAKRRILALNKKDLANPNIMNVSTSAVWSASSGWKHYLLLNIHHVILRFNPVIIHSEIQC